MSVPRPAHCKAFVGNRLVYACTLHTERLAVDTASDTHPAQPLQPVPSTERDSASVWCSYCEREP